MTPESIGWREYSRAIDDACRRDRIPLSGTFELTPFCNFRCRMCYVRLDPDQVCGGERLYTAEEWLSLGHQAAEAGTLYLLLTGGEVFARRDFRRIYEGLSEMGFLLSVYSNGYLIDADTVAWLRQRPPYRLRITLYGASDDTYERVCGVRDGFTVVRRNLDRLRDAGIPFSLAMTVIRDNDADADAVRALAEAYDVPLSMTREVVRELPGVRSRSSDVRCGLDERIGRAEEAGVARRERLVASDPDNAFFGCGSVDRGYWVTWNGRMQLCSMLRAVWTDAFGGDLPSAFAVLCDRLAHVRRPDKCRDCRYADFCPTCPGYFNSETGDPEKTSAYLCEKAKRLYMAYSLRFDENDDSEKK